MEVARIVNAKQNGKHLVDGNEFTYKKSPTLAEKVYYVTTPVETSRGIRGGMTSRI